MIGVIDYGAGNIASVINAIEYLNFPVKPVKTKKEIENCSSLIMPGVGVFSYGMSVLSDIGLIPVIRKHIEKDKPFLGICLGMQLLFEKSDESEGIEGLCIIKGEVNKIIRREGLYVPHVGWNDVNLLGEGRIINNDEVFYFVHSYACHCQDDKFRVGVTNYGIEFDSAVEYGNVFGVQFHPEKSHKAGFSLLKNFGKLTC